MRNPSYRFSTDNLTLQVLAWFSSLNVRERLDTQIHEQPGITNTSRHAELMLLTALEAALTCFSSDPVFGPALQALARHRLREAHLEESVASAIAVEDILDAGHALFYADRLEGTPSYSVPQPAPDEAAIFQQVVDEHEALATRLQQMSVHWNEDVCSGTTHLRSFFLGYIDLLQWALPLPSFLHAFLASSLVALDWHSVAASILRVDQPKRCRCAAVANEVSMTVKMALLQERCAWMSQTLHDAGQDLPEPTRNAVLLLADLCDKTTGVLAEACSEDQMNDINDGDEERESARVKLALADPMGYTRQLMVNLIEEGWQARAKREQYER